MSETTKSCFIEFLLSPWMGSLHWLQIVLYFVIAKYLRGCAFMPNQTGLWQRKSIQDCPPWPSVSLNARHLLVLNNQYKFDKLAQICVHQLAMATKQRLVPFWYFSRGRWHFLQPAKVMETMRVVDWVVCVYVWACVRIRSCAVIVIAYPPNLPLCALYAVLKYLYCIFFHHNVSA